MQKVVDEAIDEAIKRGGMEVVSEFASPLPMGVISEILGVPAEDRPLLRQWADDMVSFQGVNRPSEEHLIRAQNALAAMRPYILNMIEERRRQPREDLISKFAAAEANGERVSEAELINTCVTLFVAGHETTIALITSAIYTLLSHPDQLHLLLREPSLLAPAVEEVLRFESPVSRQPRRMKAGAHLNGKDLKEGQMVFQMLNAANRDPQYFTDPDAFNIQREKNKHIAFGYGAHFCAGATLARVEALIAVGTLLRRLPNLKLVHASPDWDVNKRNSRVLKSFPVRI
jgi:cytochrome P450